MRKKKNKAAKHRLVVFGGISLVAIIYFIISFMSYTLNIKNLKKQEKNLTNELTTLKEDAEQLKIEIEKLKDPEYIARYAREEFSYSKTDGEYIIKIEEKEKQIIEENNESNNIYKFLITGIGIILLCIIIYIIRK